MLPSNSIPLVVCVQGVYSSLCGWVGVGDGCPEVPLLAVKSDVLAATGQITLVPVCFCSGTHRPNPPQPDPMHFVHFLYMLSIALHLNELLN